MQKTLIILVLILAFKVGAQDFQVTPDSLEGQGRLDELNSFHAFITNLWDQENIIHWEIVNDIPEGWTVEICQGTFQCWPPWIQSADLQLPPSGSDTLIIKFRTSPTPGVGRCAISLTAQADANFHQQYTFVCRTTENGVRGESSSDRQAGFGWLSGRSDGVGSGLRYNMPVSGWVRIDLYDLQGHAAARLYEGIAPSGVNFIPVGRIIPPAGVYIICLEGGNLGMSSQKITIVK
ncbi:MAG: T9SS type A sorting domain-containing protein [Calditrichota bacterium]